MSSPKIVRLLDNYSRHIAVPWQAGLAGVQKVIFVIYPKHDELRLRVQVEAFEAATKNAGHGWHKLDISGAFAEWMSAHEYRDGYFESPEDLQDALPDFIDHLVKIIHSALQQEDEDSVVALVGISTLYGFARCSDVIGKVAKHIKGRLLVFFPGSYEQNNYHLLDARDGWNYQAVPITATENL